jgi:hypothetical protein
MPGARRIFAGVSGSPGSVHALRHAAGLAHRHDAILIPLLAWVPPGGNLNERKDPSPELRQLWEGQARQRLWDTSSTQHTSPRLPWCWPAGNGRPGNHMTVPTPEPSNAGWPHTAAGELVAMLGLAAPGTGCEHNCESGIWDRAGPAGLPGVTWRRARQGR